MGNTSSEQSRARRFFDSIQRSSHQLLSPCCITDDNSREQSRARNFFCSIPRFFNSIPRSIQRFFSSIPRPIPLDTDTQRWENLRSNAIQVNDLKPEKVAIGPQHFLEERLDSYQRFKLDFHSEILRRTPSFTEVNSSINPTEIRKWCDLRSIQCSVGSNEQSSEYLISMMAKDGLFLLQILRSMSTSREGNARASNYMSQTRDSYIGRFFPPLLHPLAVKRDIMKIKNQIPISILQKILVWEIYTSIMLQWITTPDQDPQASTSQTPVKFQHLSVDLQDLSLQLEEEVDQSLSSILQRAWPSLSPFPYISADVHLGLRGYFMQTTKPHLLQVVYQNIIGFKRARINDRVRPYSSLPRAAELTRKGRVKFSACKGQLDGIRFDSKTYTFHLPIVEMHEGTLTLMKNLLKFERTDANKSTFGSRISTPIHRYVELMCQLIKKDEDVEVLRDSGIILNHYGTDQPAIDFWHGIPIRWKVGQYEPIATDTTEPIRWEVGQYEPIDTATTDIRVYTRKHRRMCAELREKYFSQPWVTISLIGAWILFIFTGFQTYFSWKQYMLQLADSSKKG